MINPLGEVRHPGVDSRNIACTSNTPSDKSNNSPPPGLTLANERAAPVSSAGILPNLTSGTDLALAEAEPVATSCALGIQGTLQLVVAAVVLNQRKINLVLDELEGTINLVLSPSCHPASHPSAVVELVAKLILTRGQTSSVHIRFVQVDVAVSVKDGDVVAQPSSIELRVLEMSDNVVLIMSAGLWGVEAACVVFANTDFQGPERMRYQIGTLNL